MNDGTADAKQRTEALIADLNNVNTSFRYNEEAGERRVQFFIGLLTAVIAALAVIAVEAVKGAAGDITVLTPLVTKAVAAASVAALLILLAFGALTFFRIVKRDCVTEEYKAISSYRRRQLALDDPFDVVEQINKAPDSAKRVNAGGLAQLMAGINSIMIFALSVLAISFCSAAAGCWPYVAIIGFLIALGAATWQLRFGDRKRKDYRRALEAAFDAELDKLRDRAATSQRVT